MTSKAAPAAPRRALNAGRPASVHLPAAGTGAAAWLWLSVATVALAAVGSAVALVATGRIYGGETILMLDDLLLLAPVRSAVPAVGRRARRFPVRPHRRSRRRRPGRRASPVRRRIGPAGWRLPPPGRHAPGLLVFLAFTSLPVLITPIVADVRGDPASWAVLVPITLILLSSLTVLMRLLRQVHPAHARPRSAN